MNEPPRLETKRRNFGAAGWLAIALLGTLFGISMWYTFYGYDLTNGQTGGDGYIALAVGAVLSMALGGGLTVLLFYSHRKGYDR